MLFLSKVNLSVFAVEAAATGTTAAAAATEAAKARAAATDAATADAAAAAATDATAVTDAAEAIAVATDGTPAAAKEVAAACLQDTLFLCLSLTLGSMCNRHGCHQTFAAEVAVDSILL